jgi:hypothetical protein
MTRSFSAPAFQGDQLGAHFFRDGFQFGLPEVLGEKVDFDARYSHDPEARFFLSFLHLPAFPVKNLSRHKNPLPL